MELVERGAYLAGLGEHLAAAAGGHGRLVLVGGEAGIGKTTLVRHVRRRAREGSPGSLGRLRRAVHARNR